MKTVLDWLSEIEDDAVRAEAVCNAVEAGHAWDIIYTNSLCCTIFCCFHWRNTPQGHDFWDRVYLDYRDAEFALKRLNDKRDKIVSMAEVAR